MKNYLLFLLFLFIGCSNPDNTIEIYLLKSRAKNKYGISPDEFRKINTSIENEGFDIGRFSTVDTLNKKINFAGEFDIYESKLEDKPFISDEEIEYLDLKTNKIKFTESAAVKISFLRASMREGTQFVITNNKKPVFGGYFWNTFSSFGSDWNCISYVHNLKDHPEKEQYNHILYKGNGMGFWLNNQVDLNKYLKFLHALEESNKLKNR